MLDMEDLAVMAAGVNDQTVSPPMLKLCQSALEGGAGVHAVRAGEVPTSRVTATFHECSLPS
jgi:hypothetical protein